MRDKAVLQPACNNARELISVKKAGAGRCVGFDISDAFIEQGRRLAKAGNGQFHGQHDALPMSYSLLARKRR